MSSTLLGRARSRSEPLTPGRRLSVATTEDSVPSVERSDENYEEQEHEEESAAAEDAADDEEEDAVATSSIPPLRSVPGRHRRKKRRTSREERRREEEIRALHDAAVRELSKTAQARATAEKERLEQERMMLQQAAGDAEAQFLLKRRVLDAQQNAAEIDRLVKVVEELSTLQEKYARERAEKRLEMIREEQSKAMAQAKAELEKLQRFRILEAKNLQFKRAEAQQWIGGVAGLLGMDSIDNLICANDDGLFQETKHLKSARVSALHVIQRYVCAKVATWEKLRNEHAFLRLIAAYYIRLSRFSSVSSKHTSLKSSNLEVEQNIYEIMSTTFKLDSDTIADKMLGKLNRCQ